MRVFYLLLFCATLVAADSGETSDPDSGVVIFSIVLITIVLIIPIICCVVAMCSTYCEDLRCCDRSRHHVFLDDAIWEDVNDETTYNYQNQFRADDAV